ncbi:MAG: lipopolysaccharide transport periplasmic protein LptA [Deltaproteobacteria bacterium]|nr:lipopolysaccharide transport periplasmic protein LptA [Deltaproteobacteria bacterium]
MKLPRNKILSTALPIGAKIFLWAVVFMTVTAFAADTSLPPNSNQNNKIHITADRLIADSETKNVEFIGNVRVTQGTSVITADRVRIFYHQISGNKTGGLDGENSIEKIIANGNIKIRFKNILAVSEQAVYILDTKVLVLTGPDSKISSKGNSVTGEKITLNRANERITVEGGNQKRVEAILYPGEKGIQ